MAITIQTNFDRCSGCCICQLVCSEKLLAGYNPRLAALKIITSAENLYQVPQLCNQCQNAFCAKVCPVKAFSRDKNTGALIIDEDLCTGCEDCIDACPFNLIAIRPDEGTAYKCNYCGGEPGCAASCPTGALQVIEMGGGELLEG